MSFQLFKLHKQFLMLIYKIRNLYQIVDPKATVAKNTVAKHTVERHRLENCLYASTRKK